ncbi:MULTISPECIES: FAD/NAD(P)-binding protein [Rhizobium]|uniref:FAD-dependent urate hydroxylase HpyO/Asp monooxygenase CreE-like FAD/NAD(P)-binding domain-containing protein n=1 Tax=Rhizobium leguminosarum TaxID=384 RepID=A0A1B1CPH0_RHILE|nr:FAD/NAD(P)-binding protein [Rhizobium leguminosarum]ANP91654.1 hypothetical protein BA011_36815 [Rhizobium leguminosarum]API57534.1 hypothetical protein BMW22_40125 [Rhizobium leguminosarum]
MFHSRRGQTQRANIFGHNIAIIGGGPTALYFLKHVVDAPLENTVLTFFSSAEQLGPGMPYSPSWVAKEHLANIACEEIPDLEQSPHEWLASQPDGWLADHNIRRAQIGPSFIPTRWVLGEYLNAQFTALAARAASHGIAVQYLNTVKVKDIEAIGDRRFGVIFEGVGGFDAQRLDFDKVVIATGHEWPSDPQPNTKFLTSPWPISRLTSTLAKSVGIIGSSLSAVDVCLTIARMNGEFIRDFDGRLEYVPDVLSRDLKIVLHSRRGLLPSLRFHFEYPRIQVHQYISEDEIRDHIAGNGGFLSLDFIFERSLKQAVAQKSVSLYAQIAHMDLEQFIGFMYERRQHHDQFGFLRQEYTTSFASLRNREPIFWKEILDDVAYTLNFYAKYLNKVDFDRTRNWLMPLVSHVVAFLPQQSCEQLLALNDAGHLTQATISGDWSTTEDGGHQISLSYIDPDTEAKISLNYDLIVDCRGQRPAAFEKFPFPSLARQGTVSPAKIGASRLTQGRSGQENALVGGVDVDDRFHTIGEGGEVNKSLFVLAAPHIHGLYPYHSGLPFCNEATKIVARALFDTKEAIQ